MHKLKSSVLSSLDNFVRVICKYFSLTLSSVVFSKLYSMFVHRLKNRYVIFYYNLVSESGDSFSKSSGCYLLSLTI